MGKHLRDEQIARYHADGFVSPVDLFSPEVAAGYRARMEALEAEHGLMKYAMKPYLTVTMADEIAHDETLLDAVEDLIGPNLLVWDGAFINKEPQTESYVSWHQDLTYWGIGPPGEIVSIWLALSPVTPENGGMRMIPGSHHAVLPHVDKFGDDNLLSRGQELDGGFDEGEAVDVTLKPGQMSIHHGLVIHSSNPNHSDQRRIGLNFQFITPAVRQEQMTGDSAQLVRGADAVGHFAPEPQPRADFAPDSIAFAEEISARRQKLLFRGVDEDRRERYGAGV